MKRYEKYKEVDLPWLKEVPEGWDLSELNAIFSERRTKVSDIDYKPLSVTKNGVLSQLDNVAKTDNGENRKKVLKNDFVINSRSDRKGSSGISDYDGSVSLINTVLKIRNGYKYYWHYLLRSVWFQEEFYRNGKGIVADLWSTKYDTMKKINIPNPPIQEQIQIANFLDWKISEIDKLIELEKSKIEKLEEYKRSFAEYLVYKNNEKQTHKIMLSQCTHEQKISNKSIQHQNLLSLSYGKIVRKSIDSTSGLLPESFDNYQIVHDGNIILRLTDLQNDQRSLRVGLAKETGIITSAYVCLKTEQNIIPEYLYLHLHTFDLKKGFYGMGAGVRQSLNYKEIKKLPINISSLENQKKIVNKYNEVSSIIELSKKEVQNQITYLEELKQTLISDVVTGKMDVRDIEIPINYKKEI